MFKYVSLHNSLRLSVLNIICSFLYKPTVSYFSSRVITDYQSFHQYSLPVGRTSLSHRPIARNMSASEEDIKPLCWLNLIENSIKKSRRISGGNYVQIATVDQSRKPRCRTVVFRGFEVCNGRKLIKMITDLRSGKVAEISANPSVELVWWFSQSSEQYRISGELQLVGSSESETELQDTRLKQWQKLSDSAREQFYWPQPGVNYQALTRPPRDRSSNPTEKMATEHDSEMGQECNMKVEDNTLMNKSELSNSGIPPGGRDYAGNILPPPDTFQLMLLHPQQVRYLRLRDNYAQVDDIRTDFEPGIKDECDQDRWVSRRVNP